MRNSWPRDAVPGVTTLFQGPDISVKDDFLYRKILQNMAGIFYGIGNVLAGLRLSRAARDRATEEMTEHDSVVRQSNFDRIAAMAQALKAA